MIDVDAMTSAQFIEHVTQLATIYCPVCGRHIEPSNIDDFLQDNSAGFVYMHDDASHSVDDMTALEAGIQ